MQDASLYCGTRPASRQWEAMEDEKNIDIERLADEVRRATEGPEKVMSARKLSLSAGMGADWVRNFLGGRAQNPKMETIAGVAAALNKDVSIFFKGQAARPSSLNTVEVIGSVAAGVWREQAEWPESDRYSISVGPSPYPGEIRFAVVVEGHSMDRQFPPGTILDCVRVAFSSIEPHAGDYVICAREMGGLHEMTCKRLEVSEAGEFELHCESTRPEFQNHIPIGRPDEDFHVDDGGVRVLGLVVGAYKPILRRRG